MNANGRWALMIAVGAALSASSCCVLPLVLVIIGASGAWLGMLRWMQPYSLPLALLSAALLLYCWRQMRGAAACAAAGAGACPVVARSTWWVFWCNASLVVLVLSSALWAPWFY